MTDPLGPILGPLDGARIEGGCDECEAYQTVRMERAGIYHLTVHHDDWCPVLAEVERRQAR